MVKFQDKKYRLVTRSDFDGLVCAMILKEIGILGEIKFVHPNDVQNKKVDITDNDILTNLPYSDAADFVFDHHESEELRLSNRVIKNNYIIDGSAPSASRVVYNYAKKLGYKLDRITDDIMCAVDKADSAQFDIDDILHPKDWVLLSYIMDARTGLGRFHDFRISNYNLMMELIDYCLEHPIDKILQLPDVQERIDMYFKQEELFKEQLNRCSVVNDKAVIIDLRNEETIYTGNRFMIYAMFPEQEVSVTVVRGFKNQNTPIMLGRSIINKNSNVDLGELCLRYGGGGHLRAATCQVENDMANSVIRDILEKINS